MAAEWEAKQLKFFRHLLVLFRALASKHNFELPPVTSSSIDEVTLLVEKEWKRLTAGRRI